MDEIVQMRNTLIVGAIALIGMLVLGNTGYQVLAATEQEDTTNFHLQFMAVPQKLIHNTGASLLVYAVDDDGNPIPVKIPAISVTSSDSSVVKITDVSSSEFDNSVKVGIHAGKIGTVTVTAAAHGFLSSEVSLEVVGDAYKPEGLIVKAVPSSFSHLGPSNGYMSVQLVNFFGNPVPADEDIAINLSSSNSDVVSLSEQVTIKKGENFIVKDFPVSNPGIALLQAEVPDKWKESVKITVTQPKTPLQLKLYVAPQIAPALQGALIYGFVQLYDANDAPIKADRDIPVQIIADSVKIRQGTGVIKKGTNQAAIQLRVSSEQPCASEEDLAPANDNFNPCVQLTAVSEGFKTKSVLVELREPITRADLSSDIRFDDPNTKIEPVIFPIDIDPMTSQVNIMPEVDMPLLADGGDHAVGVVQLMTFVDSDNDGNVDLAGSQPYVSPLDLPLIVQSDDSSAIKTQKTRIPRGSTSTLIEGKAGYQAGSTEITVVAEFFGESFTKLTMQGHDGITMVAEPLIDKIMAKTDFPYIVYFKDSEGTASYSINDIPLSISKVDQPEAEIGTSKTTTEILSIESGTVKKGTFGTLLKATSKGKGTSTLTIEGSTNNLLFSAESSITMNTQIPEKLELFIPNLILGNAKYTVPLQVLDKDGFPIKTLSDNEIMLVPSIQNIISAPAKVTLPKGEYYTTFLIGANKDGTTELAALANNFQSTKLDVAVSSAEPKLVLEPSADLVKIGDKFTVALNSAYVDIPLQDLKVVWSSDKAQIVSGDRITDEFGDAEATFVMNQASPFTIEAEVSGPGYRPTTVKIDMNTLAPPQPNQPAPIQSTEPSVVEVVEPEQTIVDKLLGNAYFFALPVVGGVIFWLVKTERIPFPLERISERFHKDEE